MTADPDPLDLTAHLLVAMPGMGDPRFEKSVIFLCSHSEEGAMGLVVNQLVPQLNFGDLLDQLKINAPDPVRRKTPIHIGGPVEHGRGFVLHSGEYHSSASTLRVTPRYGMTATLDILEDIASGRGPEDALMALGYSGWGPGQLEGEISRNGWLTCRATPEIVFAEDTESKWEKALELIGVDPRLLSGEAGRA